MVRRTNSIISNVYRGLFSGLTNSIISNVHRDLWWDTYE